MANDTPQAANSPIPAPDVATTSPDVTLPTGPPAEPAAPAGSVVIPSDYAGTPTAVPAPAPHNTNNGFKAGFGSANPQYQVDDKGNVSRSNPTPATFKGILGGVLGGALRGAAYGMAAEKGESGAAAAQRLSQAADERAQATAQKNFENVRMYQREKLQNALTTAQTVSLQQRAQIEQEDHVENMKKAKIDNEELALVHKQHDEAMVQAHATMNAELHANLIEPVHKITDDPKNSTYVDAQGNTVTPSAPDAPKSAIVKLKGHAFNIAQGNLKVIQNGKSGDQSGFNLYNSEDFAKPITQPFYFQLPTTMTHPDGTPVMRDVQIKPDQKTTYNDVVGMLNNSTAQIAQVDKQLAQQAEQKKAALEPAAAQSKIDLEKAQAVEARGKGAEAQANAGSIRKGQNGTSGIAPAGYLPPTDIFSVTPQQTVDSIKAAGGVIPGHFNSLLGMARYEVSPDAFPVTPRKGDTRMARQDAVDYVRAYLDPNYNEYEAKARGSYLKEFESSTRGDGVAKGRLNTAIEHMTQLAEAAKAVPQHNLIVLNKIAGEIGTQTGNDAQIVYKAIANKLASEQAGAIKGGTGSPTDQEITKAYEGMDYQLAPEQQAGQIATQARLLQSAAHTMNNRFKDTMQRTPESMGHHIYMGDNEASLNTLLGLRAQGTTAGVGQPTGANLTPAAKSYLDNR